VPPDDSLADRRKWPHQTVNDNHRSLACSTRRLIMPAPDRASHRVRKTHICFFLRVKPLVGSAAAAMAAWLAALKERGITSGALFRRIRKGGTWASRWRPRPCATS
jgi:hypothetical protein